MMRFYIYVSEAKLEMLYGQIPRKLLDAINAEFTLDFKLVKASIKNAPPSEPTREEKLELVEEALRREGQLGTIDSDHPYFFGRLPMNWGPARNPPTAVFFTGRVGSTILGLGGSARHLLGAFSADTYGAWQGGTVPPDLLDALTTAADSAQPGVPAAERWWARDVEMLESTNWGITSRQHVNFVALRVMTDTLDEGSTKVVLGTPLYVALSPQVLEDDEPPV